MTKIDRLNTWVRQCVAAPERDINRVEVRRALSIFTEPDQTFYVQGLPSAHWHECHGSKLDEAVEAAYDVSEGWGVYFTLNPCRPGLAKMPRVPDVLSRHWFLIDVDRSKAVKKANPDSNATEAEKLAATKVIFKISDWLWELDWPNPIMTDSGNGNHLYYRIDLPNDPLSRALLKSVLANLKRRFDTPEAEIGAECIDARRITKLPGTWARKGPHSDERPHRLARLVSVPDEIEAVTLEQLQAAGGETRAPAPVPVPSPHLNEIGKLIHGTNGTDLTNYVKRSIELECSKIEMSSLRNNQLNEAAHSLGTMDWWPEMNAQEAREALRQAACRAGLDVDTNCGMLGIARTIESGWTSGASKPRERPQPAGKPNPNVTTENGTPTKLTIGLDEIVPEKVDWLWEDRLVPGFISIFAGRTGLGKSFTLCDVAARLSRGECPPFSNLNHGVVRTLFISEDPLKQMLGPRLIEMGADRKMIRFMTWEAMGVFTLDNVAMLEKACAEFDVHPGLLVIDPPTNFLGKVDEHRNAEIRAALKALIGWLEVHHISCGLITHINKAIGKGLDAVERIVGSIAWGSMARMTIAFAKDPDDASVLICGGTKNNLGDLAHPLAYQIIKTEDLAKIKWIGKSDVNMEDAMNKVKKKTRGANAVEWLTGLFRQKREWESDDLRRMAKEVGVSKYALFEAPEVLALPITKRRRINGTGEHYWVWIAEIGWPKDISESSESSEPLIVSPIQETQTQDSDARNKRDEVNRIFGTSRDQDPEDSEGPVLSDG